MIPVNIELEIISIFIAWTGGVVGEGLTRLCTVKVWAGKNISGDTVSRYCEIEDDDEPPVHDQE